MFGNKQKITGVRSAIYRGYYTYAILCSSKNFSLNIIETEFFFFFFFVETVAFRFYARVVKFELSSRHYHVKM